MVQAIAEGVELLRGFERDIPTPVTGMSQQMLMAYRDLDWPAENSVALLCNQYGGHQIHRPGDEPRRR
jgi:6-phosphogluconate dehydrogenase (decarboxylating)